jgi:hypothetical protein
VTRGVLTVLEGAHELGRAGRPVPGRGKAQDGREVGRELPQVRYGPAVDAVEVGSNGHYGDSLGSVRRPRQELQGTGEKAPWNRVSLCDSLAWHAMNAQVPGFKSYNVTSEG